MENKIKNIENVIDKLGSKDFDLYFFTLDTKGNPTAGIANIYETVKVLGELGYRAHILHEKNDYKITGDAEGAGVSDWLGLEYGKLSHVSIENSDLKIKPEDFIVIPEIFSTVMEQVKNLGGKKVVFCQSYAYALELLPIGRSWTDYGFNDVITTSTKQADYIKTLFPAVNTHVIPVSISDEFKDSDKPKMPIVSLHTRNSSDASKIVKMFYLKNPLFRWVSFKELKGLKKENFANEIRNSCLSVWVDDVSGFGTFPLESIKSNTPVIGKIPDIVPEWMEVVENGESLINNNGMWVNSLLDIPDMISNYLQIWLEDNTPKELTDAMSETAKLYTEKEQVSKIKEVFNLLVSNRTEEYKKFLESEKQNKDA